MKHIFATSVILTNLCTVSSYKGLIYNEKLSVPNNKVKKFRMYVIRMLPLTLNSFTIDKK